MSEYQDRILLFDTETAESWARITTAVRQQLQLVTCNVSDFEAVTLGIVNPWEF